MDKNYYQILGLPTTCSDDEIKKTYRKLAIKFHPDKNSNDKYFEEMFKELQEAYDVLSDPTKRRDYDIRFAKKTEQSTRTKSTDTKREQGTTPESLATDIEAAFRKLKWAESGEINYTELLKYIDSILNDNLVTQLLKIGDIKSNERIVDAISGLFKFLVKNDIKKYMPLLVKLSGANNELITKLHKIEKEEIRKEETAKIFTAFKWVAGIAIVIWIIYMANSEDRSSSTSNYTYNPKSVIDTAPEMIEKVSKYAGNKLKTGDSPYNNYFGKGVYDKDYLNQLEVKNGQSLDVIVCLTEYYGSKRTIRNEYIRAGESFTMTNIPNGTYYLKSFYGKDWNPDTLLYNARLKGFFDTSSGFSVSDEFNDLLKMEQNEKSYSIYSVTLYPVEGGNMESRNITASDFFKE